MIRSKKNAMIKRKPRFLGEVAHIVLQNGMNYSISR